MAYSLIAIGVIAVLVIVLCCTGYVKAPPNVAYIISGPHKKSRTLVGRAGIKIPFIERLDKLQLGAIQIDVTTKSEVPTADYININLDSNVNIKVGTSATMLARAAENFLNMSRSDIAAHVVDMLEGNIREIIGQMHLTEMVSDRVAFAKKVSENAVPDLAAFGLELISFNVQTFSDSNGVIDNLGIDNVEQIRKNAAIAKSDAQREIAIVEANNAKVTNEEKTRVAEDIAVRQNDLAIKRADLQKESDTRQAMADAAKLIESENQRKLQMVAATEADIAEAEKRTILKEREIDLKERELDALVRKQADADRYSVEQKAEADRIAREKEADAKKYAAFAEAEGIAAIGAAEAEAIQKKAEAQKQFGEASILEMILNMLPQVVANASAPLTNVDKITMYGEGNQNQFVGDVMKSVNQVFSGLAENGIDVPNVIKSVLNREAE